MDRLSRRISLPLWLIFIAYLLYALDVPIASQTFGDSALYTAGDTPVDRKRAATVPADRHRSAEKQAKLVLTNPLVSP
jgi:hypothetical protein